MPEQRNGKNVRDIVVLGGVQNRVGAKVLQKDECASEKAEPQEHGGETENVVKRKNDKVLDAAFIKSSKAFVFF